jgi:hypothetical protein
MKGLWEQVEVACEERDVSREQVREPPAGCEVKH